MKEKIYWNQRRQAQLTGGAVPEEKKWQNRPVFGRQMVSLPAKVDHG